MPKPVGSPELRDKIRAEYQRGDGSCADLATKYGLKPDTVSHWAHRDKWDVKTPGDVVKKVVSSLSKVSKVSNQDPMDALRRACNWPLERWAKTITGVASFDPAMLYESTPEGETRLRKDWIKIAREHGALESIKATMMTLESGMVVQKIETKAYSKMDANEKLGRILGYDKTGDRDAVPAVQVAVVLNVPRLTTTDGESITVEEHES